MLMIMAMADGVKRIAVASKIVLKSLSMIPAMVPYASVISTVIKNSRLNLNWVLHEGLLIRLMVIASTTKAGRLASKATIAINKNHGTCQPSLSKKTAIAIAPVNNTRVVCNQILAANPKLVYVSLFILKAL